MVGVTVILLSLAAGTGPSEADVLAYGKRLNVNRLDSRLGSERCQAWLRRTLGGSATIKWSSDDCGEAGMPLFVLRALLGHSSVKMTERYAHLAAGQSSAFSHLLSAAAPANETPASGPQVGPSTPEILN